MGELLIKTKLHQPRAPADLVARPRLLSRLDEQPGRKLTLVIAPAGYGKTTIVSQWLSRIENREFKTAWVSLDEEDSALGRCWRYLVAAIQHAYLGSCPETAALLEVRQPPPGQRLADELANELADLPGRLALVLDDYHHIDGQPVHEAFSRLVAYLPSNVQLVVTSRVDVPWPLGRLRGQGQLTELRAADLRFTDEEVLGLLGGTLSGEQLEVTAAQLCARTEGWAVGLQLAHMSLRAAPNIQALITGLRGTSRYIADYLLDEVLGQQPEALQRGLLILAVPERFCQRLCDDLLTDALEGAGPVVAADLERQGLFLVALDAEQIWYRFHHLVRDLLVARLVEAFGQGTVAALHRRCSGWFAAHGFIEEAVHHALAAGDKTLAAEVVERSYEELLERDDGLVKLAPLLALLPEPIIQGRPQLLLAQSYDAYIRWDLPAVGRLTKLALAQIDVQHADLTTDEIVELSGDAALLQGILSYGSGDGAQALALMEQAYRDVSRSRPFLFALAITYYAAALQMSGDFEGARRCISEHLDQGVRQANKARAHLVCSCCLLDILNGRLDWLAGDMLPLISEVATSRAHYFAWGHYFRGRLHYERNELDQARQAFSQASSVPLGAMPRMHHDSLAGLARIALAQGDLGQAAEHARQARIYASERPSPLLAEVSASIEAALALSRGDLAGAGWLVNTIDTEGYYGTLFWLEQPVLRRAQVWLLQGASASLVAATKSLEHLLSKARAAHNVTQQIYAGALLAMAREAGGASSEALETLAAAVALAAPQGFVRLFVDCGPTLAPLLRRLAPASPHQTYIRGLLAAFAEPPRAEPVVPAPLAITLGAPTSPLSEREQEILDLLAERLADQEIADRLIIAITTVRTHTRSIYVKLEVQSRRQAIERARQLGLLTTVSRAI